MKKRKTTRAGHGSLAWTRGLSDATAYGSSHGPSIGSRRNSSNSRRRGNASWIKRYCAGGGLSRRLVLEQPQQRFIELVIDPEVGPPQRVIRLEQRRITEAEYVVARRGAEVVHEPSPDLAAKAESRSEPAV